MVDLTVMHLGGNKQGFTIVELLIVVVVIAILATITVVAFNGIQNRAHDTAVQADLKNFGTQAGRSHAENGTYPVAATTSSIPVGIDSVKASKNSYDGASNNFYYCVKTAADGFSIIGRAKSGKTWVFNSNGGISEYTAAWTSSTTICPQTLGVASSTSNYSFTYGQTTSGSWFPWVN